MKNVFKGSLKGYLCEECFESLSEVEVLLYHPYNRDIVANNAVADPKETFHYVTEEEAKKRESLLIARTTTDVDGNFEFEIDEKFKYEAFDIDFACGTVPSKPPIPKRRNPVQFHITTLVMQWRNSPEQDYSIYDWEYYIPHKSWCYIRGRHFDSWVICGVLTNCKTGSPLAGVKVIAMDADFIKDDELGSDVTDSNGKFKIYYTSAAFKKTFLSPLINIETDVNFPFASGPDVYFHLEYNGQRFELETSANRRNNVGHCLCVKLCTKDLVPSEPTVPPSFTHFGLLQHIPIQTGINASGKTNSGCAFYSSINLIGTISKKINNNPMEYLFEYQEVPTPSTALNPAAWQPVNPNMINKTVIGYLWTLTGDIMNPIEYEPYYINGTGTEKTATFNGNWIQVPQESNFAAHQDAEILNLNTEKLTGVTFIDMSMPAISIGNATVSAARPHTTNRFFAIRMRQREINNAGTEAIAGTSKPIAIYNVIYNNVNKHGSWAPTTVSSQRVAVSVNLQEIISGVGGCSKITTDLHIKYGARNENLGSVSLSIVGPHKPGQSFGFDPIALLPTPETYGTTQLVFDPPTQTVNDLLPCAYTISISATALLTNGESNLHQFTDFISFCKV